MGRKPLPRTTRCKVGGHGSTRRGAELKKGGCAAANTDAAARKLRQFAEAETVLRHWRVTLTKAVKAEKISDWAAQQALSSVQWAAPFATKICAGTACRI